MQWDIFCRVIDNHGDLGVSWRLSADLAARGHTVRLWVDEPAALRWMAPGALEQRWPGVEVLDWERSRDASALAHLESADVWVECFGCEIAPEFIAFHAIKVDRGQPGGPQRPCWINLEYLSAEDYVARCHGLPSPVMHGAAQGWTKHFFYPGFTPATGGLLREPGLLARAQAFASDEQRTAWLADRGVDYQGELLVSLFCYEPAMLGGLLQQLDHADRAVHLLVTPGRAQQAVAALQAQGARYQTLQITQLEPMSQRNFDHLLWLCDLNFVRGEDSLVRALWAGKPLVWQIYPQHDDAHHAKLEAFLQMLGASASLRRFHQLWNGFCAPQMGEGLPLEDLPVWAQDVQAARSRLMKMDDLTTRLVQFVAKNR